MTYSAKTVFYFGIYLFFEGIILLFIPNTLLAVSGLPTANEVWIRFFGMTLAILGYYYVRGAQKGLVDFFYWTVQVRIAQFFVLIVFVVFAIVHPMLLVFSAVECVSGLWTWLALKYQKK